MRNDEKVGAYNIKFNTLAAASGWDVNALRWAYQKGLAPRLKDEIAQNVTTVSNKLNLQVRPATSPNPAEDEDGLRFWMERDKDGTTPGASAEVLQHLAFYGPSHAHLYTSAKDDSPVSLKSSSSWESETTPTSIGLQTPRTPTMPFYEYSRGLKPP
ncbi:hypothetical protein EV361DRAFT_966927 [Lentinula raphanica]|nr:hypothetical protein EV361DRAFT_966927 [Lentinula raphanica]